MAKREVSERMLEMNLCAEILGDIRSWNPSCLLFAPTQQAEGSLGFDAAFDLQGWRFWWLQFKSPKPSGSEDAPYAFTLNELQNAFLWDLADPFPDAVHYVLPFYKTVAKMSDSTPQLTSDTWFLRVADTPKWHAGLRSGQNRRSALKGRRHEVRCVQGEATIHSDVSKVRLLRFGEATAAVREDPHEGSIKSTTLLKFLKDLHKLAQESSRERAALGQLLAGTRVLGFGSP